MANIIVLEDYKSFAAIKNPNNDEKLQWYVDYVNALILNYCNTNFAPTVVVGKKVTAHDSFSVLVPNAPVISVQEVRVNGTATTDYELDSEMGLIEFLSAVTNTRFAIEVDYTYGHSGVPADLQLSALEFVRYLDKQEYNKSRNLGNGESAAYGDPEQIPPYIRLAMNQYKVL